MKRFWTNYIEHNLMFWVFAAIAIMLLVTSFFLPPVGAITPSTLEGVAELFAFASLGAVYKAIDKGTSASVTHGGTTVTIGKEGEELEKAEEAIG